MHAFEDLMTALKESNRPYDFDKITEAYQYASKAHEGQMRQSGDPYITHPIAVAQILVELGMDTETICAGLLHDVVEDTASTLDEIKKRFGADVALMVDGVTYIKNNELYCGDTLFQGSMGRTDLYGGDDAEMFQSLKRLGSLQGYYKVFPGHGSATNLDDEKLANPFLRRAIAMA